MSSSSTPSLRQCYNKCRVGNLPERASSHGLSKESSSEFRNVSTSGPSWLKQFDSVSVDPETPPSDFEFATTASSPRSYNRVSLAEAIANAQSRRHSRQSAPQMMERELMKTSRDAKSLSRATKHLASDIETISRDLRNTSPSYEERRSMMSDAAKALFDLEEAEIAAEDLGEDQQIISRQVSSDQIRGRNSMQNEIGYITQNPVIHEGRNSRLSTRLVENLREDRLERAIRSTNNRSSFMPIVQRHSLREPTRANDPEQVESPVTFMESPRSSLKAVVSNTELTEELMEVLNKLREYLLSGDFERFKCLMKCTLANL